MNYEIKLTDFFSKEEIEDLARTTGFVKRTSPINGFNFLLTFTNGLLHTPTGTLRQLATFLANACGAEVSIQAFDERIRKMGMNFLKACLERAMKIAVAPLNLGNNLNRRFDHVFIVDSTNFDLHKALSENYKGNKGSASKSSMRIQFLFDYVTGIIHVEIGDVTLSDAGTLNKIVSNGDISSEGTSLFLADLGYFKTDTFIKIDKEPEDFFISKFKHNVKIYTPSGQPIDLLDMLKKSGNVIDMKIKIGDLECRLTGAKLDQKTINKRLRRANKDNARKGRTISQSYKIFLTYSLFITNLPEEFNFNALFTLYRLRWQIELVFKTWKSILKIHVTRSAKESNVLCKVYGKLIVALVANGVYRKASLLFEYPLSFHQVLQHMKVMAYEWTKQILADAENHLRFLEKMIRQVKKICRKGGQGRRATIESLLNTLSLELDATRNNA